MVAMWPLQGMGINTASHQLRFVFTLSRRSLSRNATFQQPIWLEKFSLLKDPVPTSPFHDGSYQKRLGNFERWLRDAGASFDLLTLRQSDASDLHKGQGCAGYATSDIKAKTPVVQLPMKCLINSINARQSALGESK
jgi:hypothetical protein